MCAMRRSRGPVTNYFKEIPVAVHILQLKQRYRVSNWPATPDAKHWREITQQRDVPDEWVGREAIYPWEAKVCATVLTSGENLATSNL